MVTVSLYLRTQLVDAGELLFASHALDKSNAQPRAVNIAIEVEQMNLDASTGSKSWTSS